MSPMLKKTCPWLLLVLLASPACVVTRLADFADPEFRRAPYQNLLVACRENSLFAREETERLFSRALIGESRRLEVVPSYRVLKPTREYREGDILNELERRGIAACLFIEIAERACFVDGHDVWIGSVPVAVGMSGERELFLSYNLRLVDVANRACVWTATSEARGNVGPLLPPSRLIKAAAKRTSRQLRSQGYFI